MSRRPAHRKRIVAASLLGLLGVLAGADAATAGFTEDRPSELVKADRAKWPAYDVTPRPDDGANLALSVAKWEGRAGIPGKAFRVWAVGSSWTNALAGKSYWMESAIRQHFPNAPPIEFKSRAGGGCPWNYARGWISQFVLADQPDLIKLGRSR